MLQPAGLCNAAATFLLFLFLTIAWSKEILETTRPISANFQGGRHVGVDVQSGTDFRIGQGMLPWQPILGAKSAEIGDMPSFLGLAFHNGWQYGKADGRVNSAEVLSVSLKIW